MRNFTSMHYTARAVWAQFELLLLQQGVLYIKSAAHPSQAKLKMVVPKLLVEKALVEVHNGVGCAHLGEMKSLMKIKARFRRPGTTKEVNCYYDRCLTRAKCKPRAKPRAPLWSFTSGNPMQRIHIHIVAPLPRSRRGNRYIFTVQCSFTKGAEVFAMSNQRATTSAKVLVRNWICRFGVPESIYSHEGHIFGSKIFSEICQLLSINKTRTTTYHPEGNDLVKNLHKALRSMLKAIVEDNPATWDEHLDFCVMAYRTSVDSSTGHNQFELMFGREMRIPLDVMVGGAEDNECSYTDFDAVELHKLHNT